MSAPPPLRANWLETIEVLEGGMAFVYICTPKHGFYEGRERVAVKRLKPVVGNDADSERLFLRECFLWMQAGTHPNVVTAFSAHAAPPEQPFVVLEYVPKSLRSTVKSKSSSVSDAVRIAVEICFGLEYMQSVSPGFVHRDLKPENVLMSQDGSAKVTDFGLAIVRGPSNAPSAVPLARGPVGTPPYMAPEQFLGENASEAVDVYAIGCILYELIAGAPVFGWLWSIDEWQSAHVGRQATPPSQRNPRCPQSLDAIVLKCLQKSSALRFETVRELRQALTSHSLTDFGKRHEPSGPGHRSLPQLVLAGQGLHNLGYYRQGNEVFETALGAVETDQKDVMVLVKVRLADGHLRSGNIVEAERYLAGLDNALGDISDTSKALYLNVMGSLSEVKGADDLALKYVEEAARLIPKASAAWYNLAVAYRKARRLDDALEAVQRAIEISPNIGYLRLGMDIFLERKDYEQAWRLSKRAFALHPSSEDIVRYCIMSASILMTLHAADQSLTSTVGRELDRVTREAQSHGVAADRMNEVMVDAVESVIAIQEPADRDRSKSEQLLLRAKALRRIADSLLMRGKAEEALPILRKSHKLIEEAENVEQHERED
jgi:serine/threonine protein kinase